MGRIRIGFLGSGYFTIDIQKKNTVFPLVTNETRLRFNFVLELYGTGIFLFSQNVVGAKF